MLASWLRFLGLMIVSAWLAAGCSGPKKIDAGGSCVLNSDCNQGLVCTWGKCHAACHTTADCAPGQSCITTSDQSTVCQGPTPCVYNSDCQSPLACGADQRCRNQCQKDVDCTPGQSCTTTGTCAEPNQVDLNKNLLGPDGGIVGCPVGTETCSCYPNDTCNAGLTCASRLCVNLGTGGSGTGGSGGGSGDAGVSDVPGTQPDVSIGGTGGATGEICGGLATTTSPCSKSGTTCSLNVGGTARTYYVQLPSGYSLSKRYPVVFQFHTLGGSAEQALGEYGISTGMPDAIYVTPQGLSSGGSSGWANTDGQDIAFTKAMLADVQSKYCVDSARIFSMGFNSGGMMSFAINCEMGDVFRAIAPMSGALYSDPNCKGTGHAIAMWGSHGLSDAVVPIADGRAALAKILQQSHCGTATTPIDPSPCVSYQGCDSGYPVTWCEFEGSHQLPSFGSSAIAAFFKQF